MIKSGRGGIQIFDRETGRKLSGVKSAEVRYDGESHYPTLYVQIICEKSVFICNNDRN